MLIFKNVKKFRKLKKRLSKITIVVIRADKYGTLKNSKPCRKCVEMLKLYGFKNVYYSTGDDSAPIVKKSIKTLENSHKSRYLRRA